MGDYPSKLDDSDIFDLEDGEEMFNGELIMIDSGRYECVVLYDCDYWMICRESEECYGCETFKYPYEVFKVDRKRIVTVRHEWVRV